MDTATAPAVRESSSRGLAADSTDMDLFTSAWALGDHPAARWRTSVRRRYLECLAYIVRTHCPNPEYAEHTIERYRRALRLDGSTATTAVSGSHVLARMPWVPELVDSLVADVHGVLVSSTSIRSALDDLASTPGGRRSARLRRLAARAQDTRLEPGAWAPTWAAGQLRANASFRAERPLRVLVTATISAGKSTLINALIGKDVAASATATCTSDVTEYHSKAFDDGVVRRAPGEFTASGARVPAVVSTGFRTADGNEPGRLVLIDTPGANSAINCEHGDLTGAAIRAGDFDVLIYVVGLGDIETIDNRRHLEFVRRHVAPERTVFVVNKVDNADPEKDNVAEDLDHLRGDLLDVGFERCPVVPLAAKVGLGEKMIEAGLPMRARALESHARARRQLAWLREAQPWAILSACADPYGGIAALEQLVRGMRLR